MSLPKSMNIKIAGRHIDLGESLRQHIIDELQSSLTKYFEKTGSAEVALGKDRYAYFCDINLHLDTGQQLAVHSLGGDARSAFSSSLEKIENRVRRHKRRLKNHHTHPVAKSELTSLILLRSLDEEDEASFEENWGGNASGHGAPQAAIIAETETSLKTMTVSMAVMELDLLEQPVVVFRNLAHGGVSVVYRRNDGNIGWIDPERTVSAKIKAGA